MFCGSSLPWVGLQFVIEVLSDHTHFQKGWKIPVSYKSPSVYSSFDQLTLTMLDIFMYYTLPSFNQLTFRIPGVSMYLQALWKAVWIPISWLLIQLCSGDLDIQGYF